MKDKKYIDGIGIQFLKNNPGMSVLKIRELAIEQRNAEVKQAIDEFIEENQDSILNENDCEELLEKLGFANDEGGELK